VTELWHTLASAAHLLAHLHAAFALGALVVYLTSVVVVAFRWRLILAALGVETSVWNSGLTYSAGVFAGNVTPARTLGGDAVRIALVRLRTGASVKVATASVVYDRMSEVPALAVLALIALPVLHASMAVLGAIAFLIAMLAVVPSIRLAIARFVIEWHDAIVGVPVGKGSVAGALGCSLVVWLLDITRITLEAAAVGVRLSPSQAATITWIRLFSGLVPVPAGVGVVEGGLVAGLVWFGVAADTAAAVTVLERAVLYGGGTCLGGLSLMLLGGRRILAGRAAVVASDAAEQAFPT